MRETPAEALPGATVNYDALLVDATGERTDLPIDWAFCNAEKPLSDLADVAAQCFVYTASFLVPLGQGSSVSGALPTTGCSLFGPDVPPAQPGMPSGRPADPDPTGGYYQPVRLILQQGKDTVLGAVESRIQCGLPGATAATLTQFRMQYQPNTNPVIAGVGVVGTPLAPLTPDDGMGPGFAVKAGSTITLRASWPECPGPAMAGCGAETYLHYDPGTQALSTQREALTVSWYATGGSFASDRTGRASDDHGTTTDNAWTAPATGGTVLVWVVLRDDRGGVSWERYRLDVK